MASSRRSTSIIPRSDIRDAVPAGAVEQLNRRLQSGQRLSFEGPGGYLKALLAALAIPVESQLAVYSKTSLQSVRISPQNPRVIFFNDSTAVAWVPGGFIEVAAHDPRQGAVFYLLHQAPAPRAPTCARRKRCLSCHLSSSPAGIPGFLVRSIPTAADGTYHSVARQLRHRPSQRRRRSLGRAGTSPRITSTVPISATRSLPTRTLAIFHGGPRSAI